MNVKGFRLWLVGLVLLVLAGCGGGGGGNSGSSLFTDPKGASSLQVKLSATSVDNTGSQTVTATVTALDANGQGVAGVPLTIAVDNNATFTVTGSGGKTTASDGTVTAVVTIGSDTSLRTITVAAATGSLSARNSFQVVGSRQAASDLIITGPSGITNSTNNSITVTVTAVDANRNALANIPVSVAVDAGATVIPSANTTNSSGVVTGQVRIGSDQTNRTINVVATSGTVTRSMAVSVTGAKLSSTVAASSVATNSTGNRITYLLVDNTGSKMSGYPITVKASGLADVTGTTNIDGEFTYSFTAPATTQSLTIEATAGGSLAKDSIAVTGTVLIPPAALTVQSASLAASPNVVAVNPLGTTPTNKTEIRALFLSTANAPVPNVRVWFDLNGDKNTLGGTLASTAGGKFLYSDANGVARTTFAPGDRSSPKDGATVRACWSNADFTIPTDGGACPNQTLATLTVINESVSVSIGTNGLVGNGASGVTYTTQFAVQVVDASGKAKVGVQVSPSIDLLSYAKGFWVVNGSAWAQTGLGNTYPATYPSGTAVPATVTRPRGFAGAYQGWSNVNVAICDNEDLNRNGVAETYLDTLENALVAEDQNNSAGLSPARPAIDPRKADVTISVVGSDVTDANGVVVLKIEYPQNLGSWVLYNVLVAASVNGTEGRANYTGVLPVPSVVVNNVTASPPFVQSPYGTLGSPAFLRRNVDNQQGWLCTNPN